VTAPPGPEPDALPAAAQGSAAPPFAAYVAPFAAFMVATALEPHVPAAWWPWAYAGKLALVAALLWRHRAAYPRPRGAGVAWAAGLGVLAGVAWVWLAKIEVWQHLPAAVRTWLAPARQGFDPDSIAAPFARQATLALRLAGLALIVPLMEEVFWRGFLVRWFVAERFHVVPEGAANAAGAAAATGLFVAVHPEILAALAWAVAAHLVWLRGRNLWANVAFHAGSNAALGAWIVTQRDWALW
jgi:CAAX prenyl protease-like protein